MTVEVEYLPPRNIEVIHFPMGESHLRMGKLDPEDGDADVLIRIRNSEDVFQLQLAVDILKRNGMKLGKLFLPYLPYARQDRVAVPGEPHSLQVFSSIIDNLGFQEVVTVDIHSNVAEACFQKTRFTNYKPFKEVKKWLELIADPKQVTLIAPDEGAIKRTSEYMNLGFSELIPCFKKRDPITGKLTGFEVFGKIKTKEALVIDDICDGGGTFLGLAPKLKEAGAERLFLWCTHGGFTKGVDDLLNEYNEIGCTNSYKILDDSVLKTHRVTQMSINFQSI